jgi:hypothetical protein|nr:MAG TPA: hypothetical protein [Caudoviricetes sp.]
MAELPQADSAEEPRYRHDIRTTEAIKALTQCADRTAEMAELLRRGQYKLRGAIQPLANLRLAVAHLETAFRIGAKQ